MRQSTPIIFVILALGFYSVLFPDNFARGMKLVQEAQIISILWPQPGQAILGNIEISGNTLVDGYKSAEILFGYANDPADTWFLIDQSNTPIDNGVLANWDTTVISDGNYNIKLAVTLHDGAIFSSIVQDVRVRNYSPIEPDTPMPVINTSTPELGITPIPTPTVSPIPSTATPLPTNPIILTPSDFITGFGRGALITLGLFIFVGIYLGIRSIMRNRV